MVRSQQIPTLSVIIPTLNEASHLPLLLADLAAWPHEFDIIIVDGGSTDSTVSITQILGSNILISQKANRGHQLKLGALNAKGDWLLFLHADSRLDKRWVKYLLKIMEKSSSKEKSWYFDFKVNENKLQFKILEKLVNLRSHFLQRPYGDQGLLIHKDLYLFSGGFLSLKIMEDLELISRLSNICTLKSIGIPIITDSRKWSNSNIIQRAILNARLRKKWREGHSANKLADEYYS